MAFRTTRNINELAGTLSKEALYFDIKRFMAERGADLLCSQGISVSSDNEKINKYLIDFVERNKITDLLIQLATDTNYHGRTIITIDKSRTGELWLSYVSGEIFQNVEKWEITPLKATILRKKVMGMRIWFLREVWDTTKITRQLSIQNKQFGDNEPRGVENKDGEIPKEFDLLAVETHNLGFVPLIDNTNRPARNIIVGQNTEYLQDDYKVANLALHINKQFQQWYAETIKGGSRVYGEFSEASLNKIRNTADNPFLDDFFVKTTGIGTTKPVEVAPGTYDSVKWSDGVKQAINIYSVGCGYSPIFPDNTAPTEAETLFSKDNDERTTKSKRRRYQELLKDLFAKILVYEGLSTDLESAKDEFSLEVKENVIYNRLQLADMVVSSIDNKLMSRNEAIQLLRDLDNEEEAEEIIKQIDKAYDKEQKAQIKIDGLAMQTMSQDQEQGQPQQQIGRMGQGEDQAMNNAGNSNGSS